MKNILKFPNVSLIEQEAAAWLVKLDSEEQANKQLLDELTLWLNKSPKHLEELKSLNQVWGNVELAESLLAFKASPISSQEKQAPSLIHKKGLLFAATACSILLIGLLSFYLTYDPYSESNGTYVTQVGQQQSTELADGSLIKMNTDSKVTVDYERDFRNIHLLKGEVHFIVAKNAQRPFRVYVGNGRVEAIGTAFTIYYKDNADVDVNVTEGRVSLAAISPDPNALTAKAHEFVQQQANVTNVDAYTKGYSKIVGVLDAGQATTFRHFKSLATEPLNIFDTKQKEAFSRHQSWLEGWLVFSGESLEQVVAEMNRYSAVPIEIIDPAIRSLQIGGRFKIGAIDQALNSLESNFGIKVSKGRNNKIQLSQAL